MTTRLPDLTELAAADVAQDDLLLIRDVSANIDRKAEFGSIVERGSNANGEYVRFADGTQIAVLPSVVDVLSAASGDTTARSTSGLTPPVSFTGPRANYADAVGYSNDDGTGNRIGVAAAVALSQGAGGATTEDGVCYFNTGQGLGGTTSGGNAIQSVRRRITIIGRWK